MTSAPLLELRGVSKAYPARTGGFGRGAPVPALDNVSFSLEAGTSLGVVGESGSGKTTLAKILAGFLSADRGDVLWEGRPQGAFGRNEWAARVQMIFQDPSASLNPKLSVRTLLAEPLRQRARWDKRPAPTAAALRAGVAETLQRVGLPEDAADVYPHEFSGGQKQRIAIARALAAGPRLLLADEPVSSLDLSVQAQILNLLTDLRRDLNLTLVLISHDLAVVNHLTDHTVVLKAGRLVEGGPTREVLAAPQSDVTRALLDAVPAFLR